MTHGKIMDRTALTAFICLQDRLYALSKAWQFRNAINFSLVLICIIGIANIVALVRVADEFRDTATFIGENIMRLLVGMLNLTKS